VKKESIHVTLLETDVNH